MFNRKTLVRFKEKSKNEIDCQQSTEKVDIEELLIGYTSNQFKKSIIRDLVQALSQLQARHKLLESYDENMINIYFQDLLRPFISNKKFYTNEQSLSGKSESGKKQGELDIVIETKEGTLISFFEGFILNSFNRSIIDRHIEKSIIQYDANGLKEKFVGVYCRAANFSLLATKYFKYLNEIEIEGIEIIKTEDFSRIYTNASEMRVYRTIYRRNEIQLMIYHVLINIDL